MVFAAAEAFRTQLGPNRNFEPLVSALHERPPEDATPYDNMRWVADNLFAIRDGLSGAGLPNGFSVVYSQLSHNIANGFDSYVHGDALGRTAVKFHDHYSEPQLYAIEFLQGDNNAWSKITPAWLMPLLHPALLDADIPKAVQAGSGMGTHMLSRDLMRSVFLTGPPQGYKDEYTHLVGEHISNTIDELSGELIPGNSITRKATAWALKRLIAKARSMAWDAHEEAKLLPEEELEGFWQQADEQAARFNQHYLRIGGTLLSLAQASERLSFRRQSGDEDEERLVA